ncbi:MAG: hypothetical protein IPI34_10960 [bacterium]|nr:hypothetical protein [bacterium]
MIRPRPDGRAACLLLAALLAAAAIGCGVKITAPRAVGLFSTNAYTVDTLFVDPGARQMVAAIGRLFVVGADGSLVKRTLDYEEFSRVDGFADPVAVCTDEDARLVFVWEAGANRLSAFQTSDLSPVGSATLTDVQRVTHLYASRTGLAELAADRRDVPLPRRPRFGRGPPLRLVRGRRHGPDGHPLPRRGPVDARRPRARRHAERRVGHAADLRRRHRAQLGHPLRPDAGPDG